MATMGDWIKSVTGTERHWTSLEELESEAKRDPAAIAALKAEIQKRFPSTFLSRREFMEWTSGLIAVLGLTSCTRQPEEALMPYNKKPEDVVPGKPLFFATAYVRQGAAIGLLVESNMGRPTKVEGNPDHPASLGATDAFAQASLLELYDPDRLKSPSHKGAALAYNDFFFALASVLETQASKQGAGLRIVTESIVSPTLGAQLKAVLKKFPKAKWITHDPVGRGRLHEATERAFGERVNVYYRVDDADVLVSLDSDFLAEGPAHVRYHRAFANRRRGAQAGEAKPPRLYAFTTQMTPTASLADHRWPTRPHRVALVAQLLGRELGIDSGPVSEVDASVLQIVRSVAADLKASPGRGLVIPGEYLPADVQALCFAINEKLGNLGKTVVTTAPLEENVTAGAQAGTLADLAQEMHAGQVECLAILGGNPVYTAPKELRFAEALAQVPFSFHHTLLANETSKAVQWQLPDTHYLEAWTDVRAYDGTVTIAQPLIAPLYSSRSAHEIAAALFGTPGRVGADLVKETWKGKLGDKGWNQAVHDGVVPGTALPPKPVKIAATATKLQLTAPEGIAVLLRPDPTIWDGRHANNGWLQELPKPVTKLTWDNVVQLSPDTAKRLGVGNGDRVRVTVEQRSVEGPVWVTPGHADDSATLTLGYGRMVAGRVGTGTGFDAYPLRTGTEAWAFEGGKIEKVGGKTALACTQGHFRMEGRDLVRVATIDAYLKEGAKLFPSAHGHGAPSDTHGASHPTHGEHSQAEHGQTSAPSDAHQDMQGHPHESGDMNRVFSDPDYAWGMNIDLSVCNGCNACVVACQSENNVPVVGKDEVLREREMHWLRIDRYYDGDASTPMVHYQPVPCMHCETAPCTVVCPVNATSVSPEGINEMTYNRCVGTKYCSNNCPYKVRRFNFYHYADVDTPVVQLGRNPQVTVRARGVMEKCTYCVQRVSAARIEAKKAERKIADGEVVPACAAACPSQAITFGNLKDPQSRVTKLKKLPLNYGLLEELGTKPRTSYLAKLKNPNPALAGQLSGVRL
jgi:molybdopterin-containing oxidoreductase family iron-sulfur binding subunit